MRKRRFKIPKMGSTTFRNCAWRRRSFVIKRSFVLGNKSCNGKQFFWAEEAGSRLGHCGCTDSGGSVMNASIAYFFWWWLSEIWKNTMRLSQPCIFFKWLGRMLSVYVADVGSILCGSLEIRGHAEQGLKRATDSGRVHIRKVYILKICVFAYSQLTICNIHIVKANVSYFLYVYHIACAIGSPENLTSLSWSRALSHSNRMSARGTYM